MVTVAVGSLVLGWGLLCGPASLVLAGQLNGGVYVSSSHPQCFMTVAIAFALFVPMQQAWTNEKETTRNKAIVRDFYTTVLIGHDVDAAPRFLREDYIQHSGDMPTGTKAFMDVFRTRFAQPLPSDYKRELLNVIGDNDMVVIYVRQTWTGKDGQHHQALGFDMFRLQDGKIAEHWDAD